MSVYAMYRGPLLHMAMGGVLMPCILALCYIWQWVECLCAVSWPSVTYRNGWSSHALYLGTLLRIGMGGGQMSPRLNPSPECVNNMLSSA